MSFKCPLIILNPIENDTDIETKPLTAELFQTVHDSSEYSKKNCEICSQEFSTVEDLNAQRQQGCEGLIEIGSIVLDCKPTAVDFTGSECEIEIDEKQAIDDDGLD